MNISTGSHSGMENSQTIALSIPKASMLSGLGRTTLYAAIKSGALVARKCGKRTIILRSDLIIYLSSLPAAVKRSDSGADSAPLVGMGDGDGQA